MKILTHDESCKIWNRIYEEFRFTPDVDIKNKAFVIKQHHVIYDISKMTKEQKSAIEDTVNSLFAKLVGTEGLLYALDWQHSDFLFNPGKDERFEYINVKDEDFGEYRAYFPTYYPNGDYYFFINEDFSFGYLSHPWQEKVWIFGEKLIEEFSLIEKQLGWSKL